MKVLYYHHKTDKKSVKIYANGTKRFEIVLDQKDKIHYCKIWRFSFPISDGPFAPGFPFLPDELKLLGPEIKRRTKKLAEDMQKASEDLQKLSSCKNYFLQIGKQEQTPAGLLSAYNGLNFEKNDFRSGVKMTPSEIAERCSACFDFGEEIELSEDAIERLCSQVAFEPGPESENIAWAIVEDKELQQIEEQPPADIFLLKPGEYVKEYGNKGTGAVCAMFSSSAKASRIDRVPSFTFGMNPRKKTESGTPFKIVKQYQNRYAKTTAKEYGKHVNRMIEDGVAFFFS